MKSISIFNLVIFLLIIFPSIPETASGYTQDMNGILISWDGVSKETLMDAIHEGKADNISGIIKNGSFVNISIQDHFPDTMAGHAEMLTGYSPEITGVFKSMRYGEIPLGLTLFERLKNNIGKDLINIAVIAAQEGSLASQKGLPFYHSGKIVDHYYEQNSDAGLMGSVASEILYYFSNKGRFFIFIDFRDAANSGYAYGAGSHKQMDKIQAIDRGTGIILKTVQDAQVNNNTTIFITTDYGYQAGQYDQTEQNQIWLVANKPDLVQTGDQKDIVPTILETMGVSYKNLSPEYPGTSLL